MKTQQHNDKPRGTHSISRDKRQKSNKQNQKWQPVIRAQIETINETDVLLTLSLRTKRATYKKI